MPSASMIREAAAVWCSEVTDSLASLAFHQHAQDKPPGADGSVSLVFLPVADDRIADLTFFQWTQPGLEGRIADVTDDNFLKCIVPVGKKRTPISIQRVHGEIVIPQTGVRMVKDKQLANLKSRFLANKIPDVLCRFMRMWRMARNMQEQAQVAQAEMMLMSESDVCYICSQGPGSSGLSQSDQMSAKPGEIGADVADDDPARSVMEGGARELSLRVCPICLLCSHESCAAKLREALFEPHPPTCSGDPHDLHELPSLLPKPDSVLPAAFPSCLRLHERRSGCLGVSRNECQCM